MYEHIPPFCTPFTVYVETIVCCLPHALCTPRELSTSSSTSSLMHNARASIIAYIQAGEPQGDNNSSIYSPRNCHRLLAYYTLHSKPRLICYRCNRFEQIYLRMLVNNTSTWPSPIVEVNTAHCAQINIIVKPLALIAILQFSSVSVWTVGN